MIGAIAAEGGPAGSSGWRAMPFLYRPFADSSQPLSRR
jgi:hypothetical protein